MGKYQESFASILDTPSSDVRRPPPMPVGSYICVVQGQPRFDKSSKKGTEFVEFTLKFLEALDDVDADALEEIGGIKDKTIKATYYITETALWRLKDFLDHCRAGDNDASLRQRIDDTVGSQIQVQIRHELSQDRSAVFARVGNTSAVA